MRRKTQLVSSPCTALMLIDTANGKQRLAWLQELILPYAFYKESFTQTCSFSAEFAPNKIIATTYAQFGVLKYHNLFL